MKAEEKNVGPLTVKKLRELLAFQEAFWDEEDEKYLGKFEDTPVMCLVYSDDNEYKGVGHSELVFNYELGITVVPSLWRPSK